jgi:DNA-binding NtrC family response regulator
MNEYKIFVVDDDTFYLTLFKQQLINIGCEDITTFENGTDLLNEIQENPDVVFLDYMMDDFTGEEVLNKIKRYNPDIFVVVVSGQEGIQTAVNMLKQGAFDYLQKGDDELKKIKDVLQKIGEVKDFMERTKPSLIKRIFKK